MDNIDFHNPADMMMNGLKTSLINNFQTGNVILDSMMSMFILYLVTMVVRGITSNMTKLSDKMGDFSKRMWSREYQISFYAYEQEKRVDDEFHDDSYPVSILSIIYYMEHTGKMHKLKHLREIVTNRRSGNIKIGIHGPDPFEITKDITGQVFRRKHKTDRRDLDGDDFSTAGYIVEFVIRSRKLNSKQLTEFVSQRITEYNEHMILEGVSKHFYFRYTGVKPSSGGDDEGRPRRRNNDSSSQFSNRFDEFVFHTNRTFANVFFEQKELIMRKIDFFTKNAEWYNTRGIPYTLGMLFYGSPGCGKTSTIKAIAKQTGRHVVEIQLSKIKSAREFMDIFHNETIMGKIIPLNRRIYVLEDVDCMGSLVKNRTETSSGASTPSSAPSMISLPATIQPQMMMSNGQTMVPQTPVVFSSSHNDDKLTLSVILNALDGVLEMPGRIVIMTTNHPEQLDPALIRPGRIDMKVEFKRCSTEITKELIQHFYQCPQADLQPFAKILEAVNYKWTPAEVNEIMMKHDTVEYTVRELIQSHPHDV